jgi:hypothetical protein
LSGTSRTYNDGISPDGKVSRGGIQHASSASSAAVVAEASGSASADHEEVRKAGTIYH